jgi:hypothetical protein
MFRKIVVQAPGAVPKHLIDSWVVRPRQVFLELVVADATRSELMDELGETVAGGAVNNSKAS